MRGILADAICVRRPHIVAHAVSLVCTAMLPDEAYRRLQALMRALC